MRERSVPAQCSAEPPAAPRVLRSQAFSQRGAEMRCAPFLKRSKPKERGRSETGFQESIPSEPGIRGPLHPLRLRCPPSPYRSGYASVGRLAGSGASTLSVLGLFGNGPREAGLTPPFSFGLLRP